VFSGPREPPTNDIGKITTQEFGGNMPVEMNEMVSQLPELRAEYERLGRLIAALEAFTEAPDPNVIVIGGGELPPVLAQSKRQAAPSRTIGPDAFVGLSTSEAIKAFLTMMGKGSPQGPREMAQALVRGGRGSDEGKEYQNVASALKRMNKTGEVRQVRRGQWGLGSWYGPQSAKKANGDD
jgi:hypothetical protein